MSGVSRQKVKCVGQQRQNRLKRALCAGGAAGKIDDQGLAEAAADRSTESGKRRLPKPFGAHPLREAIDEAFADEPGGLGCYVPWGQASASGGDHQVCGSSGSPQGGCYYVHLVWDDLGGHGVDPGLFQQIGHGWP